MAVGSDAPTETFVSDVPTVPVQIRFDYPDLASQAFTIDELRDLTGKSTDGDGIAKFDVPINIGNFTLTFTSSGTSFAFFWAISIPSTPSPGSSSACRTLWVLNLGQSSATIGGRAVSDFLSKWNSIAWSNAGCAARTPLEPDKMVGAATVPFDYTSVQGTESSVIPDELTQLDGIKVPNGTTRDAGLKLPAGNDMASNRRYFERSAGLRA
jgi:hypothetical protein